MEMEMKGKRYKWWKENSRRARRKRSNRRND
jgi:hypothetical protein